MNWNLLSTDNCVIILGICMQVVNKEEPEFNIADIDKSGGNFNDPRSNPSSTPVKCGDNCWPTITLAAEWEAKVTGIHFNDIYNSMKRDMKSKGLYTGASGNVFSKE